MCFLKTTRVQNVFYFLVFLEQKMLVINEKISYSVPQMTMATIISRNSRFSYTKIES